MHVRGEFIARNEVLYVRSLINQGVKINRRGRKRGFKIFLKLMGGGEAAWS